MIRVALILATILVGCGAGTDGKDGMNGKDGLSILKARFAVGSPTDICTYYDSEQCYFNGAQVVTFSDGSIQLTSTFSYQLYFNGEYDRLSNSATTWLDKNASYGWQRMDWAVNRYGTPASLFLIYYKNTDSLEIVFDTNGNREPDSHDEIVLRPAL